MKHIEISEETNQLLEAFREKMNEVLPGETSNDDIIRILLQSFLEGDI